MTERENILRMFDGLPPKWLPIGPRSMYQVGKLVPELFRPHDKEGYDWFGVHWLPQNELGRVITHPDIRQKPVLEDVTRWREEIVFPDLDSIDWDALASDIEKDKENLGGRLSFLRFENGLWERLTMLMGFENALASLALEPDACREYAETMADFDIRVLERLLDLYPYDLTIYMDDLGSSKGPLMSPDTYRYIFKEPTRRVLAYIKSRGSHVGFHSCGRMEAFVGDLVEIGVEVLNPVQVWNDQARLKREYGDKLIFYGGLDNQHITEIAYPEEEKVRAEARRAALTLGPGGGYIVEMRERNTCKNGLDVSGILYRELELCSKELYGA